MLQRGVTLAILGTVQHKMTLAEGAALAILPRQSDGNAVGDDRRECQRLSVRPIDLALGRVENSRPPRPLSRELAADREAVRNGVDCVVMGAQLLDRNGGFDLTAL